MPVHLNVSFGFDKRFGDIFTFFQHLLNDGFIERNGLFTDLNTSVVLRLSYLFNPCVVTNVLQSVPLRWICVKGLFD